MRPDPDFFLRSAHARLGAGTLPDYNDRRPRWVLARQTWFAAAAASGLVEIAQRFPETRDAAVGVLTRQLGWWARQSRVLNSVLVHDLVDLHAVEAAPLMEAAFAADAVDTDFDDDWEDVQVALGLIPERITPPPVWVPPHRLRPRPDRRDAGGKPAGDAKRRRKEQKAARQRNRKRR